MAARSGIGDRPVDRPARYGAVVLREPHRTIWAWGDHVGRAVPDEIPDEYCTIGGVDAAAFGAYASATAATAAITKLRSRNSPTNLKTT